MTVYFQLPGTHIFFTESFAPNLSIAHPTLTAQVFHRVPSTLNHRSYQNVLLPVLSPICVWLLKYNLTTHWWHLNLLIPGYFLSFCPIPVLSKEYWFLSEFFNILFRSYGLFILFAYCESSKRSFAASRPYVSRKMKEFQGECKSFFWSQKLFLS